MKESLTDRVIETLERVLREISPPRVERALFLRAEPLPHLDPALQRVLLCEQTWRPLADLLQVSGYRVNQPIEGRFDLVLYLPTQQRDENHYNFARALTVLKPGGTFACAMANEHGAKRYEDALSSLTGAVSSLSKNRCRGFWYRCEQELSAHLLAPWLALGEPRTVEGTSLLSQPGIFGWQKVDKGSALLARTLPSLHGRGADLGAGYGYLSHCILEQQANVSWLLAVEAERLAVEMVERNLARFVEQRRAQIEWHDVCKGVLPLLRGSLLDWVVMNPPFHERKEESLHAGVTFIRSAVESLRKGGELFMVANEHLPYLEQLRSRCAQAKELRREQGFKVLWAQK